MKNTEQTELTAVDNTPMSELSNYHQQMLKRYKNAKPNEVNATPDAMRLIAFNGYYTLGNAVGAFFAVDTNIHINANSANPIYDVALLISLDGKTSFRFPFTGTFDGSHLVMKSAAIEGLNADLTFTHTDGIDGTIASCVGTIAMPNTPKATVLGNTYNNPIDPSLFIGTYYLTQPFNTPQKKTEAAVPVLEICANNVINYDYGATGSQLQPVTTYAYNLNMYFFSFPQTATITASFIMGTAAEGGLACNNMVVDKTTQPAVTTSRSLQTVPFPTKNPLTTANANSKQLAAFSGYYQLPSINKLAFLSVQAQYVNMLGTVEYVVKIGISLDGKSATGYYFDTTMSFTNNTLTMPNGTSINFTRAYNPANKSLVSISGSVNNQAVSGNTLLNPVPLTVFGGVPMTNDKGDSLTVTNNTQVVYNNTVMNSILYIPLMYILANPWNAPTTVMSFGTDGLKGNTCIVTDATGINVVYAIPGTQQ